MCLDAAASLVRGRACRLTIWSSSRLWTQPPNNANHTHDGRSLHNAFTQRVERQTELGQESMMRVWPAQFRMCVVYSTVHSTLPYCICSSKTRCHRGFLSSRLTGSGTPRRATLNFGVDMAWVWQRPRADTMVRCPESSRAVHYFVPRQRNDLT